MSHIPKKFLGQNFLKDKNIQKKIVALIDQFSAKHIVEIGPGLGALTDHLRKREEKLTLIEYDKDIVNRWQNEENLEAKLIHSDILKVDLSKLGSKLKLIGNIPYNITSPILFHLIDYRSVIDGAVLMMQKEVAERLSAKRNTKAYGILTVFSEFFGFVRYEFTVPNTVFYPKPKVDSAVISFSFRTSRESDCLDLQLFKKIVKTSFNKRRKMLRASLKMILSMEGFSSSIDLTRRPESLSVDEFIVLSNEIFKYKT
jgi:16S rRNA (adenine1518-N6/adenine1519-N6)-dimethyltransferase